MLGSSILNVFARSPLKPMQQHMQVILKCVKNLPDFFAAVFAQDWDKALEYHNDIMETEAAADEIKKEIRLNLPNNLFLPVSRSDLLALLTAQDRIASKAKHIASLLLNRKMIIPDILLEDLIFLLDSSIYAASIAAEAIDGLDILVTAGFKGQEVVIIEQLLMQLDDIERQVDERQVMLRQKIFGVEKTLHAIDVIFLYKLIDWTAELADRSQHVGHKLESIVAHC